MNLIAAVCNRLGRRRSGRLLLALLCGMPGNALALSFTVNTLADSTSGNTSAGSLRDGLNAINASTNLVNTIAFQAGLNGTILLTAPLPLVLNNVVIDASGATVTIDGASTHRIFFVGVDSATATTLQSQFPVSPAGKGTPLAVSLKRLTLQHGKAQGGAGGGGGLGAGGALFVNNAANVTLVNVNFTNNQAKGGAGGIGFSGGGGLGGNGNTGGGGGGIFGAGGVGGGGAYGAGSNGGGGYSGSGGGSGANGANGTSSLAGISGSGGAGAGPESGGSSGGGGGGDAVASGGGGFAGGAGTAGGVGGAGGFGGGGGNGGSGGNGGFGGGGGVGQFGISNGGDGGFGGGGGGTNASGGGAGGSGGFGGGGGATTAMSADGGFGGFGGGGGPSFAGMGGTGGFGGGSGAMGGANAGSGGAGFGGAVFVKSGAVLSIQGNASEGGDTVVAGASGGAGASPGHAAGSGLFLEGGGTLTFTPGSGETQSIAGAITDEVGSAIPGPPSGEDSWALMKSGAGTLVLGGVNGYSGTTTVTDGLLRVTGDISLSSNVTVSAAATLAGDGSIPVLDSSGTLVPGTAANPTGVLHAFGTVLLQAGALTCFHADGVGNSSSIFANSLANLAGVARMDFSAGAVSGTQYVLIDAGAIGGVFSGFETNMPGLDGDLSYSATQAIFTVTASDAIFYNSFDAAHVSDSPCIAAFAN